jgi:hypothetical protein
MVPKGKGDSPKGVSLEEVLPGVLAILKRSRAFVTVADLAEQAGASVNMVRKALQVASIVFTEAPCPQGYVLELDWTPRGAIAGARLGSSFMPEVKTAGPVAYEMGRVEADAVARVASTYLASPKVLPPENPDVKLLVARFPALFAQSTTGSGIVPNPSLLALAGQIRKYASLGKLPTAVELAVGTVAFKSELSLNTCAEVQPV